MSYLIIDPDGYIGDPVFDVSRFIMLEFEDDLTGGKDDSILDLIDKLEKRLHIPLNILIKCLFIDNVLWLCSDLERGETLGESQFTPFFIELTLGLVSLLPAPLEKPSSKHNRYNRNAN